MFERGPFRTCPACGAEALGLLSAGGQVLTRRCRVCRATRHEDLPPVDKKVIYLDQFAISEIHKIRAGKRRAGANSGDFWRRVERAVSDAYRLQQAIFPSSDLHTRETAVYVDAAQLALTHSMLGGDTRLASSADVGLRQVYAFADAYFEGRPPPDLDVGVDQILWGDRNAWLDRFHISAEMNFGLLADDFRGRRDGGGVALDAAARGWARDRPTFKRQLEIELESFATSRVEAMDRAAAASDEEGGWFAALSHPYVREFRELRDHWMRLGLSEAEAVSKVRAFWFWAGNRALPHNWISAHLFAALARKMGAGQKKPPGRGAFCDITAIATYAPYVDAMFVDAEFAGYLREQPLLRDLGYKARIFSIRSGEAFIQYLEELCLKAGAEVRLYAAEIYG